MSPLPFLRPPGDGATRRTTVDDDEHRIRELVEHWVAAVREGDMGGVLAQHAEDIVIFDLPPPQRGVRGIQAYRETWPPFFDWQRSGAGFAIEELDVTTGTDVAYAWALLRCGTAADLEEHPDRRLRLTLGLRRERDAWVAAHEHHSFTDQP